MNGSFVALALVLACGCATGEPVVDAVAARAAPSTYAHPLNVDFMVRGYFYAGSVLSEGLGGYGRSDNLPRPLDAVGEAPPLAAGVDVVALVDQDRTFADKYDGFRVIVANVTDDNQEFGAQDSRLDIVHEAIDPSGKWAPIEYLPRSWCGNSYHRLFLPRRTFWELTAPHYDGDFATRLRIRVDYGDADHRHTAYSNEWAGRINRAQFSQKQGHRRDGVMDPYDE